VDTITRKRHEHDTPRQLVISVERKGGRSLIVSIRGSTVGVLVALALLAAAAWVLTH
jgi:hypothetical protein